MTTELQSRILRWRKGGPALFAVEALGVAPEFDPASQKGILPWQWEASKKIVESRRLSIRSGHGVGKSAFLSWSILWFMTCFFPTKIPCTAPTAHQLSDVLWAELAKWHRTFLDRVPALANQFEWTKDEFRMKDAPKESFAVARTARADRPEALQGFHSDNLLILVDEASGVPDVIFEVGQGALSSVHAYVILTGNPTRTTGFFFETHHRLRERWATMAVNGEEVPLVSKQFIDDISHQYGADSNVYKVRVRGEFPTSEDDAVIPLELCESAILRDVELHGPVRWGLDVARFGDDRTVLVKRRENGTTEKHKAWSGVDTMQTAGRVYSEYLATPTEEKPEQIFVDVIGIGAGVADRLGELGLPVVPVNVGEASSYNDQYNRLRDELWFLARKALERLDFKLAEDDALVAELSLPKYKFTSSGKLQVESKDDLKKRYPRSPDIADAFCLTFGMIGLHGGKQYYEPEAFGDGM